MLADESVNYNLVRLLRAAGFEVAAVIDDHAGIADIDVLELSRSSHALVLTEDRDFGEWIFAHHEKTTGVIFLRYRACEMIEISSMLLKVLIQYRNTFYSKFVVIAKNKVRIRDI